MVGVGFASRAGSALTDDLTRVTAAMAAIPGLAVYLSVDGSPWVHRLQPIEWGGW